MLTRPDRVNLSSGGLDAPNFVCHHIPTQTFQGHFHGNIGQVNPPFMNQLS